MKNAKQRERLAARDASIFAEHKRLERLKLRTDYIYTKLQEKFFLSERKLREIVREQALKQPA